MNEYEINGSEFSGASASTRILKAATALATAVLTGYKTIVRNVSATVEYRNTVIAVLLNQYNGVISIAAVVSHNVDVSAAFVRSVAIKAMVSAQYQAGAFITAIRRVASQAIQGATQVTANLKDQFNGLLLASAQVANSTVITAKAIRFAISTTLVRSSTSIIAKLAKSSKIATAIYYDTQIEVNTILQRALKIVVQAVYDIYAGLSVVALLKTYILHAANIAAKAVRTLRGTTEINSTTTVTANLKSSATAPASADNTFVVPPDDTTYDVENS